MSTASFFLSLPRKCVGKPSPRSVLYESPDSLPWEQPDPQITPLNLLTSPAVLDPLSSVRQHFPDTLWTNDTIIVPTLRAADVVKMYKAYGHCEISLDIPCISQYAGGLKPTLKPALQKALTELAQYANVSISVSTNFVLNLYGTENAVDYAKYKLFVLLNHFYGYSIMRLELPLSQQPLVAGVDRQHLLTIFQQTGVNVYMPPMMNIVPSVSVNEVYLAGDRAQVVIARKLIDDVIIRKTESLITECSISVFVRDALLQWYSSKIEDIMCRNATYIQMPPMTDETATLVRIMGTTRRSIENSLDSLMKLCGEIYVAELRLSISQTQVVQLAADQCNVMSTNAGVVLYGPANHVKVALQNLKNAAGGDTVPASVLLEQPVELMDFILGKKQGKVTKVMNVSRARITIEKLHELNFRIRVSGRDLSEVLHALRLMEDELPAEKSLYIPEVYHKQVIGQGGQAIQMLMRKYNVYMRFANTTKDKSPNAFGDTRSDNVIVRCPAKNRAQIDRAVSELQQLILDLASKHKFAYVRLTRNHRRLLLSSHSNALRDAEVAAGAAINLPSAETRETQFVEISGQTEDNTRQAAEMLSHLLPPIDYEFRIPWSSRFVDAVGPRSQFGEKVSTPLFLAMSAQVQAFERVQMHGDPAVYSQIVVSVQEEFEGECFDDISQVITSYLRMHNLDIVDKGELRSDIVVESHPFQAAPQQAQSFSTPLCQAAHKTSGFAKRTRSPNLMSSQAPQVSQLAQLAEQSKLSLSSMAPPSRRTSGISIDANSVTVPKLTPRGLPARPPMAPLQWNRNYDETPVKKRNPEMDVFPDADDSQTSVLMRSRAHTRALKRNNSSRPLQRY